MSISKLVEMYPTYTIYSGHCFQAGNVYVESLDVCVMIASSLSAAAFCCLCACEKHSEPSVVVTWARYGHPIALRVFITYIAIHVTLLRVSGDNL